MGNTRKTNRESRQLREESVEENVTLSVADAKQIIEAKVDDMRTEVGQDIGSKVVKSYLESGKLDQARKYAKENDMVDDDLKDAAGQTILSLVAKGETELAARVAA